MKIFKTSRPTRALRNLVLYIIAAKLNVKHDDRRVLYWKEGYTFITRKHTICFGGLKSERKLPFKVKQWIAPYKKKFFLNAKNIKCVSCIGSQRRDEKV